MVSRMKKGKKLNSSELEAIADGKTNIIVVSQSGYERICMINKSSLEDAMYDIDNRFCEIYLSE